MRDFLLLASFSLAIGAALLVFGSQLSQGFAALLRASDGHKAITPFYNMLFGALMVGAVAIFVVIALYFQGYLNLGAVPSFLTKLTIGDWGMYMVMLGAIGMVNVAFVNAIWTKSIPARCEREYIKMCIPMAGVPGGTVVEFRARQVA